MSTGVRVISVSIRDDWEGERAEVTFDEYGDPTAVSVCTIASSCTRKARRSTSSSTTSSRAKG